MSRHRPPGVPRRPSAFSARARLHALDVFVLLFVASAVVFALVGRELAAVLLFVAITAGLVAVTP